MPRASASVTRAGQDRAYASSRKISSVIAAPSIP
jgi:hypothetical protein